MLDHMYLTDVGGSTSLTFECGDLPADAAVFAAGHEPNGYRKFGLSTSRLAVVVDGHRQVILGVCHKGMKRDVGDLDVAELVEGAGNSPQKGRHVSLTGTRRVALREVQCCPCLRCSHDESFPHRRMTRHPQFGKIARCRSVPTGQILLRMSGRQNPSMDIDADRLTETLAGRLAAIVPDGFHVQAAGGMLWCFADGGRFPSQLNNYQAHRSGTYVRDNFEAYAYDLGDTDGVVYVVECALDNLQDLIDEATHDPWPGTVRPPRPFAQIRDEMLHLWYGGPEITSPVVLACEPIPLAQIQRSP